MYKFLFVTLLTITASSFSMENETGTSMPYGNDIASYVDNEPAFSSCDTHEIDYSPSTDWCNTTTTDYDTTNSLAIFEDNK